MLLFECLGIDDNVAKFYWKQLLQCVAIIHREGIVHRDLKPANFLSVSHELKLIDLGIASKIENDATHVTAANGGVGTPNYMSPECLEGGFKIGYKADVWSLGCMLYHMVYKRLPFGHVKNFWMKRQVLSTKSRHTF